jgi:hypothetical protein
MKTDLQQALSQCLARMEAGADIDACLRDQGTLASELRPLLEAAQVLREERQRIGGPSVAAIQAGRMRMHAVRGAEADRAAAPWFRGLTRPLGMSAAAVALAVLLVVGLTSGLFSFGGATTTSAHGEGVVSRVDQGSILLNTNSGQVVVWLRDKTVLQDANGRAITGGDIVPGALARVEANEENGEYQANNIEFDEDDERVRGADVEFSGVLKSVSGSDLQVEASFGTVTVRIDASTEVKGTLADGARLEMHATRQDDGSFLAREVEVKTSEGAGADDSGSDSGTGPSGSGSDSEPGEGVEDSGSGSTSGGGGSDDHGDAGDESEHAEDESDD